MQEIGLEEMKKLQYDMLVEIARFCDDNNMEYYLSGGTLLGAVRHKGFIPWDDDIDIMMPRDDYERFIKNYHSSDYVIDAIEISYKSCNRYARVNNINTVLLGSWKQEREEHVFIDIFPLDGIPNNFIMQKLIFIRQSLLIGIHLSTMLRYTVSTRYADRNAGFLGWRKYLRTFIKFCMLTTIGKTNSRFWADLTNKYAKKYRFGESDFVACLVSGANGSRELTPYCAYESKVKMQFENGYFWVPCGFDIYLSNLYGDYMKLPPVDKRQSHHDFKAYWKDAM